MTVGHLHGAVRVLLRNLSMGCLPASPFPSCIPASPPLSGRPASLLVPPSLTRTLLPFYPPVPPAPSRRPALPALVPRFLHSLWPPAPAARWTSGPAPETCEASSRQRCPSRASVFGVTVRVLTRGQGQPSSSSRLGASPDRDHGLWARERPPCSVTGTCWGLLECEVLFHILT